MKDGPIRTAPPTVAHYGTMPDEEAIRPHTIRNILARDYALSFLVFFGFLAVFHSLTPTLPLYLAKLGSNKREVGVLVGSIGVTALVSGLLVGRVHSGYSERLVMMGAPCCSPRPSLP